MQGKPFRPEKDIPNLSGKVIFITGGTAGLGRGLVLALAKHSPSQIYFSGRNETNAAGVISAAKSSSPTIPVTFVKCDLASLASVATAVKTFTSASPRLDLVILNAGIMAVPSALTTDGYEIQFGTNHLGHALLVKLLLPTLTHTTTLPGVTDVRIVSTTSVGFRFSPSGGIKLSTIRTNSDFGFGARYRRYAQSKLANLVYSTALAERYPMLTCVAVHPGVIKTELVTSLGFWDRMLIKLANPMTILSAEDGIKSQLWAATAEKGKDGVESGKYYEPVGVLGDLTKDAKDEKLRNELWEWTQKELEAYPA